MEGDEVLNPTLHRNPPQLRGVGPDTFMIAIDAGG
jgi:hypothetical protein